MDNLAEKSLGFDFNKAFPDFSNKEGCKKVGGKFENNVCWMTKTNEAGWTAPIKGAYLWYHVGNFLEDIGGKPAEIIRMANEDDNVDDCVGALVEGFENGEKDLNKLLTTHDACQNPYDLPISSIDIKDVLEFISEKYSDEKSTEFKPGLKKEIKEAIEEPFSEKLVERGKWYHEVMGCMVVDSGVYPTFAGGCSPILEGEIPELYDMSDEPEVEMKYAQESVEEIVGDIQKGRPDFWRLKLCNPVTEKETTIDDPFAVLTDKCQTVGKMRLQLLESLGQKQIEQFHIEGVRGGIPKEVMRG